MVSEYLADGLEPEAAPGDAGQASQQQVAAAAEAAEVETDGSGGWTDEQLAIIEEWKRSPEGKRYIAAITKERSRKLAQDVRKALHGDPNARDALGSEGRRFLRLFDELARQLETEAHARLESELARLVPASRDYNQLLWEQQHDTETFARRMADPRIRAFFNDMEALHEKYGGQSGERITNARAKAMARGESTAPSIDDVLAELREEDEERLLSEQDWDAIEDVVEAQGNDTRAALRAARRKLTALLAERKAEARARPLVEEAVRVQRGGQAARAAAAGAPVNIGGRGGVSSGRTPQQIIDAYYSDPGNPRARAEFERLAKERGWRF